MSDTWFAALSDGEQVIVRRAASIRKGCTSGDTAAEHARSHAARAASAGLALLIPGGREADWRIAADSLLQAIEALTALQHTDGTVDSGNLRSPPDTAFVMQTVGRLLLALRGPGKLETEPTASARSRATEFMLEAAEAVRRGGVHTPNHRWVVCSALAYAFRLSGDASLLRRIDEWTAEGIDIDEDGQYAERSAGIYSAVSSEALLSVALLTNRLELLEPVRRNLFATLVLVQPDGRIETVASRRQDQYDTTVGWFRYYAMFRVLAALDRSSRFAAAARTLERLASVPGSPASVAGSFIGPAMWLAAHPEARRPMPEAAADTAGRAESRLLRASLLFRRRSGRSALTVFGGQDGPESGIVGHDVSGRSRNPTVLTFAIGSTSLRWLRLLPRFFGTGYLRPHLVSWTEGTAGAPWRLVLRERRAVGYAAPLDSAVRRSDGCYELDTADGRYFSNLSLRSRSERNEQSLSIEVRVTPADCGADVEIDASASTQVPVWLELAFSPRSELEIREVAYDEPLLIRARDAGGAIEVRCRPGADSRPQDADYGDFEIVRRYKEARSHREQPLQAAFASFQAPGRMSVSIRGRN